MIRKMIAIDWRAMKVYQIRILLIPILAIALGWTSSLNVIPLCLFACFNYSLNTFAVEDKGALNNLYLTMPVKRNSIVAGRYALSLIMVLCGILIGVPIMYFVNMFAMSKWYIGINGYLIVISLSFLLYAVFNLSTFPILFKLGYVKGKFIGVILPVILFGLIFGAYPLIISLSGNEALTIELISYASENIFLVSGGILLLATVVLLGSYALSVRVYSKRDF